MTITDELNAALAPRYEIERQVGEGGMATVYLARDLRHNRPVAIKVLKRELGALLGTERFLTEIAVTAGLQHPHLLPLFDSGEVDGLLYYVMPYIEGETLRARLARERQLPIDEAIRLTRGIASALEHAHKRGVIHRDLKPENILIHADEPLVSDFGIALAVSKAGGERMTQSGITLGTPQYMSPEQAAGDHLIDARSDVYSLGAMLYEMLAGEPPHTGPTPQAIIAKIVSEDPKPLTSARRAVSPELDAVVERALEKLPADRYASAGEFATTLGELATRSTRASGPAARSRRPLTPGVLGASIAGGVVVGGLLTTGLIVLTGARGSLESWRPGSTGSPGALATSRAIVSQLTNYDDSETGGAISPDGRSFVFVSTRGGHSDIWRRQIAGGDPVRLTNDDAIESGLVFAQDGESIYYTREAGSDVSIWQIGALGGQARKVLNGANVPSPSPDGKMLAWFAPAVDGSFSLMVGASDGTSQRLLAEKFQPGIGIGRASWSPDGRMLAFSHGSLFTPRNLFTVDVADGATRQITHFEHGNEGPTTQAWLPDNQHIVVSYYASAQALGPHDLGIVDVRSGSMTRLTTNVTDGFDEPSLSADATRMLVTASHSVHEVWKVPFGPDPLTNGAKAVRLVDPSYDPIWTFVSRDGRTLLFNNAVVGSRNLWTSPLDGVFTPRQLTSIPGNAVMHSALSPDGNTVAFASTAGGTAEIWLQDIDGSRLRQLTRDGSTHAWPVWSPDGRWIMFGSFRDGVWTTQRVSAAGGEPEKIADGFFRGDWIARPDSASTLIATSTQGNDFVLLDGERHTVIWKDQGSGAALPVFSADGKSLSIPYPETLDRDGILVYDVATGSKRVAVRFPHQFHILFRANWVDNGRAFVVNRYEDTSHIVLFDRFWVTSDSSKK